MGRVKLNGRFGSRRCAFWKLRNTTASILPSRCHATLPSFMEKKTNRPSVLREAQFERKESICL
jgi:hypothetical protein